MAEKPTSAAVRKRIGVRWVLNGHEQCPNDLNKGDRDKESEESEDEDFDGRGVHGQTAIVVGRNWSPPGDRPEHDTTKA